MVTVVRMPAALAGVTEAAVQSWLASVGQNVAVGDPLVEIETEKAVVEYAAETAGVLVRLLADAGENLPVGTPIAVIATVDDADAAIDAAITAAGGPAATDVEARPETASAAPPPPAAATPDEARLVAAASLADPPESLGRLFASPIVRRLARERGIDLEAIEGSGPGGRIVRRDLERASATTASGASAQTGAVADPSGVGFEDIPLSGMRRAIARRLTESKSTVPHFYVTADCKVDELLALRARVNASAPRKISVNDFVLKAVAAALVRVPAANAIWNGDSIRRFDGVDIAVAVSVEQGLLTPVVRGVDRSPLGVVSEHVAELAERARAGRLQQHELEGGSFAVSNLGMYGVDSFSAILNPPQSGILAVGAATQRAIVVDGELAVANVMTVTLSADHRVLDGAVAAEWMAAFVELIENPVAMLV